jgi:hypothetical protein
MIQYHCNKEHTKYKEGKLTIMKVVVLSDGEFNFKEINNELEDLQKIVGGYIEVPFLTNVFTENGIDVIINEEGKFIEGLRPEIAILDGETNKLLDIVYGNCIFASHDEEGETTELNEEQLAIIEEELKLGVMLSDANKKEKHLVRALIV